MMDPELMRLAQEQMSKISPDDLLKMQRQIMANPDLMRMASENMKNLKPEDIKFAAEQMKHVRKEEMAEISERISRASPEEIATMKARANLQSQYQLQVSQNLKNQGNQLHALGKYSEAAEKYSQARSNLTGIPFSEAKGLLLASLLNLMSCYLKTKQFEECVQTGSEVLAYDAVNVKALYRRGQAYKLTGKLELAIADLRKAVEASPDDETIAQALREANAELTEKGGIQEDQHGPHIEEITEEEAVQLTAKKDPQSAPMVTSVIEDISDGEQGSEDQKGFSKDRFQAPNVPNGEMYAESLRNLSENPDMFRTMQSLMENVDPDSLVALSGGKLTPDMVKTVSGMFGRMSPEELQNMVKMSSTLPKQNQATSSTFDDMTNGHSTMGPSPQSVSVNNGLFEENQNRVGESSMNLSSSAAFSGMPSFSSEMQEQMRNQMNDPATRQMFSSMIKNMSPEMMASMSEQFGFKLSHEDAVNAQNAMASLSPNDLDRLMNWAARLQSGINYARKIKNWVLGRPGLIFAISMLLLAIILHRFGYIGD
jgi:tetratricopeptide (TPR) repeat protein